MSLRLILVASRLGRVMAPSGGAERWLSLMSRYLRLARGPRGGKEMIRSLIPFAREC